MGAFLTLVRYRVFLGSCIFTICSIYGFEDGNMEWCVRHSRNCFAGEGQPCASCLNVTSISAARLARYNHSVPAQLPTASHPSLPHWPFAQQGC